MPSRIASVLSKPQRTFFMEPRGEKRELPDGTVLPDKEPLNCRVLPRGDVEDPSGTLSSESVGYSVSNVRRTDDFVSGANVSLGSIQILFQNSHLRV